MNSWLKASPSVFYLELREKPAFPFKLWTPSKRTSGTILCPHWCDLVTGNQTWDLLEFEQTLTAAGYHGIKCSMQPPNIFSNNETKYKRFRSVDSRFDYHGSSKFHTLIKLLCSSILTSLFDRNCISFHFITDD